MTTMTKQTEEEGASLIFMSKHDTVHPKYVEGCYWCGGSRPFLYSREQILKEYEEKHG